MSRYFAQRGRFCRFGLFSYYYTSAVNGFNVQCSGLRIHSQRAHSTILLTAENNIGLMEHRLSIKCLAIRKVIAVFYRQVLLCVAVFVLIGNCIRGTNKFVRFFLKIWGFIVKNRLQCNHSKYHPLLAFFHVSGNLQIPSRKNDVGFDEIPESTHFSVSS